MFLSKLMAATARRAAPGNPSIPSLVSVGALDEERRTRRFRASFFHELSGLAALALLTAASCSSDEPEPAAGPGLGERQQQLVPMPTDPLYEQQWHYQLIKLPAAWQRTTGSPSVRIAILDTGRNGHPELDGKWVPGLEYNAVDQTGDARAAPAVNTAHAAHVAAIAAGETNNGIGGAGVCWDCQLIDVKVTDASGVASAAAIARGIRWAADHGAHVINLSLGRDEHPCDNEENTPIREAVIYAISRGTSIVAAAGNQGLDAADTTPAACPGVISVASVDRDRRLADYSNRGGVTLAAPGGGGSRELANLGGFQMAPDGWGRGIDCPLDGPSRFGPLERGAVSAWTTVGNRAEPPAHCWRYLSGTSMATPHVSGVIGLMLSRNPGLTPAQIRQILIETAQPLPTCNGNCGAGLLDADAAVAAALTPPPHFAPTAGAYYNPRRSGVGIDLFPTNNGAWTVSWYTYRPDGRPIWYTSDVAPMFGTRWTAPLYRTTWNGFSAGIAHVGSVSLSFTDPTTAWFSWVLDGVTGGEPFVFLGGGQGRAGAWYSPAQPGWGIAVQEWGTTLSAAFSFYENGEPIWAYGERPAGPNLVMIVSVLSGPGLCPGCSGTTPAAPDPRYNGWITLDIPDGSSTAGTFSSSIVRNGVSIWSTRWTDISLLTKP